MSDYLWEAWAEHPTGRRLEVPGGRTAMTVRVLAPADPERVALARRHWPEASPDDFERAGRRWVDRATGEVYRVLLSNPLLGADVSGEGEGVSCFAVADGSLVFLRREGTAGPSTSRELGSIGGRRATQKDRMR